MINRFVAFALAIVFLLTLSGCAERSLPDAPAQSSTPASEPASQPQNMSDISTDGKSDASALPPDENAIKAGLKSTIDACVAVFDIAQIPEQGYFDPTGEEYAQMQAQVAKLGVPVDARDCDMKNHEQVVEFYNDAKSGKDAHVTIYSIRNFGISSETFVSSAGKISHTLAGVDFGEPDSFSVDPPIEVASLELTDGGHLICFLDQDGESTQTIFCVVPHGDELRELRRKYIDPVSYGAGGTLTVHWDKDNMSALNWEFLFEQLNFHSTGKFLFEAFPMPYPGEESRIAVPAAEVDSVLQSYFPVSTETLHSLKRYDSERKVYAWQGFSGGGYSPTPEVTAFTENPDGSLTLTVGALALEFGKEYAFTSEITIMPRSDGSFQYLSNKTDSPLRAWEND